MISTHNATAFTSSSSHDIGNAGLKSSPFSLSKFFLASLLGSSAFVSPAAARALFSPRAEFAARTLSQSGASTPDFPNCVDIIAQAQTNATVVRKPGEGVEVNGEIIPCFPDSGPISYPGHRQQIPIKISNDPCSADVIVFDTASKPELVAVKGTTWKCKIAHSVVADAKSLPGCDNLLATYPQLREAPVSIPLGNRSSDNYGTVIFDPRQRVCAESLLQMITARSVHEYALAAGIPMTLFAALYVAVSSNGAYHFDDNTVRMLSAIMPIKHALLVGSQSAVGAAVLNHCAKVEGHHNPFAGYDMRDSFIGGAIGSLMLGVLPLLFSLKNMRGEVENHVVSRQSTCNSFFTQFAGAALGAAVLKASAFGHQNPSEAAQAGYAGSFLLVVAAPLLEFVLVNASNRIMNHVAALPERNERPAAEAHVRQPVEQRNGAQVAIELPGQPRPAPRAFDTVAAPRAVAQAPGEAVARQIKSLLGKREEQVRASDNTLPSYEDLLEQEQYKSQCDRFICPISLNIMEFPVNVISNGHAYKYDRASIMKSVAKNRIIPQSTQRCTLDQLEKVMGRDHELQSEILGWLIQHEIKDSNPA